MASAWGSSWGAAWGNSWGTRSVVVTPQSSGGFVFEYERYAVSRDRARRKRKEAEEAALALLQEERDREIAEFLHKQEAADAERQELQRLSALVTQFADQQAQDAFTERTAIAFDRALTRQTEATLQALDREMQRQMEEEEMLLLMTMMLND